MAGPGAEVPVLYVTCLRSQGWQEHCENKAAIMSSEVSQAQARARQKSANILLLLLYHGQFCVSLQGAENQRHDGLKVMSSLRFRCQKVKKVTDGDVWKDVTQETRIESPYHEARC